MPSGKYLTTSQEDQIVSRYQAGLTHAQVAQEMNLSAIGVQHVLKRRGVKGRTSAYPIDETFFDVIDTPEKAYFLGWILSDGHCLSSSNHIVVSVTSTDMEVLVKLGRYIGFGGKVRTYRNPSNSLSPQNSTSILCFCNPRLSKAIRQHGCHPSKTYSMNFPNLPHHVVSHFLRGFIEGDGHFCYTSKNKFSIGLLGTHEFMKGVVLVVKSHLGIDLNLISTPQPWMSRFCKGRRSEVMSILNWIYADCKDMYLDRKYREYLRMKEIHATKPLKRVEWTHRRDGRPRKGTPLGPRTGAISSSSP